MRPRSALFLLLACLLAEPAAGQAGRAAFEEGVRLMRSGDPSGAEKQFERAIAAERGVADYHYWLARAVGQQAATANRLRQPLLARRARAAFERAVELDPDHLDAREGLVVFFTQAPGIMGGSKEKARQQVQEIARRNTLRGHQAEALVAWSQRDTTATERALRAAMAAAPDSAGPVIQLSQRQSGWGRTAAAFATLDAFLARHPGDVGARYQLGRLAAVSGEHLSRGELALRDLLAGPEWTPAPTRPTRATVHFRLGQVLERAGRPAEARSAYEAALSLDPGLTQARNALASLR